MFDFMMSLAFELEFRDRINSGFPGFTARLNTQSLKLTSEAIVWM